MATIVARQGSSPRWPSWLESEVQTRLQNGGGRVVAGEVPLVSDVQSGVGEKGRVGRQNPEIEVERDPEQVRGERPDAVVAREIAVHAVDRGVLLAPEGGGRLGVVAVLVSHVHALVDVLAELR